MPIYEYRCPNGHVFELFQGFDDPRPETCATCGAGPVQRVLYPVAVHYKGSGFYSTDYGRGSRKAATTDGGEATTKSTESGSGSSEKPVEKKAAEA